MTMDATKSRNLMNAIDWRRPELAAIRSAPQSAAAFIDHVTKAPRPRFRFEYERKAEIIAFLAEHYDAWRNFDLTAAGRLARLSLAGAKQPRALVGLPELGRAWWATGDPRFGAAAQRFYVESATGEVFNWGSFNGTQSAIELDAFFLLLDCPSFTTAGRIALLDHLQAVTDNAWESHVSKWRQTMLGPEGHNWYLHGMRGLPMMGLLFPEFKRAEFWLKTGWSVVEEHVRGHYKSDGGARETTLSYQAGSMHNLWDLYLVARRNGWPVSAGFLDTVLNATKFLLRLMTPMGGMPSFGDGEHAPGQLTHLAAIAAAISGDGECKWYAEYCRRQVAAAVSGDGDRRWYANYGHRQLAAARPQMPGQIPYCAFWDVGLEGARTYAQTRSRDPGHVSVLMGATGYAALRDSDRPDSRYLAIAAADRGPIVTSHGHNDIFSLDVCAAGVRFIGEMGCVSYGASRGRAYDEKTEAHSTLTIKGEEQTGIVTEWRWSSRTIPAVRRWISEPTHDFFHGVHEGFYRYPDRQILHSRKVLFIKAQPSYWIVMDWLDSESVNNYEVYFHGCVAGKLSGRNVILGNAGSPARLAIVPPRQDKLTLRKVAGPGLAAYIREKHLDAAQYPCFACSRRAASDCFIWVIAPLEGKDAIPVVKRLPVVLNGKKQEAHEASAVQISWGRITDTVCISHRDFDATMEFGGDEAWGHLAFRRRTGRRAVSLSFEHTMSDGVCGR